MIKSLSPYYLTIPFVAPISEEICTSYTLQIFVWNGLKNLVPAVPTYEVTKLNPTGSDGSEQIDISLLTNDFIDFAPFTSNDTELIDGFNQYWVKTQVLYTTSDEEDFVPNFETTVLMTSGYGYAMEGINPQIPSNNILLNGTEFKVSRSGKFVFPILIEDAEPVEDTFATITNLDESGCLFFTFNQPYTETGLIVQTSINDGATWTTSFGGITSPRCGTYPTVTTWYRLKSIGTEVFYSNIYIETI